MPISGQQLAYGSIGNGSLKSHLGCLRKHMQQSKAIWNFEQCWLIWHTSYNYLFEFLHIVHTDSLWYIHVNMRQYVINVHGSSLSQIRIRTTQLLEQLLWRVVKWFHRIVSLVIIPDFSNSFGEKLRCFICFFHMLLQTDMKQIMQLIA